jgi:drug/metabolite transporter (DMT)-like permease
VSQDPAANAPAAPDRRFATIKGILSALLGYFLFSSSDAVIKLLLGTYSTFQILPFQALFAMIPVTFMILGGRGLRMPRGENLVWVMARGFLAGLGAVLGFFAFSHLPLADVYALAFCAPLIVTVLAPSMLGEKIGPRRWAAVIVGFIGVLVMVRPGFEELKLGHLAALATAFSGAGTLIIMRRLRGIETASTMATAVMLGLLAISLPVVPFVWVTPDLRALGLVAASGLMMGTAQFFMLRAVSLASAAVIAPMQYTMMIWAVFYGFVVFATDVSPWTLLGSAIVVASSLYTMYRERVRGVADRGTAPVSPAAPPIRAE